MFSALGWALMSAPTPAMPAEMSAMSDTVQSDHGQHVLAPDALAQHEGVLRADRGDQRERGDEAEDQGRAHGIDGRDLGSISTANNSSDALD